MDTRVSILLNAVGCGVLVVTVWCAVLALSSRASGWRRLAKAFANPSLVLEASTRFLSARIGPIDYNGALNATAGDLGLALVPMRLFRPFHPALLLPWTEMQVELLQGALSDGVRLTFPSVRGARLRISGRAFDLVRPYLDRIQLAHARPSR